MTVKSKITLVARWSIVALYNTSGLKKKKNNIRDHKPSLSFILPLRLGILAVLELKYDSILLSVSYRGAMFLTYLMKTLN